MRKEEEKDRRTKMDKWTTTSYTSRSHLLKLLHTSHALGSLYINHWKICIISLTNIVYHYNKNSYKMYLYASQMSVWWSIPFPIVIS